MDAANLLKPMLARGQLRCIGATTLEEYRKHIEKDAAFERRFQQVQVGEPSVEDTISILRGLKNRYESHHGVRITDNAVVLAAKLAKRYLTTRKLPDSAIDITDESCANVRVQIDSVPEVIDQLERTQMRLEVESRGLAAEKDRASKQRLAEVQEQLASVREQLAPLNAQHQAEKASLNELRAIQAKIEQVHHKIEAAERRRDLATVADLRYGAIPDLNKRMEYLVKKREAEQNDTARLTREVVDTAEIADVVSRWTGIPVSKLTTSEKDKLLGLGKNLSKQVIGQDEAVTAVAEAGKHVWVGLCLESCS